jgi:hypothetical protein
VVVAAAAAAAVVVVVVVFDGTGGCDSVQFFPSIRVSQAAISL